MRLIYSFFFSEEPDETLGFYQKQKLIPIQNEITLIHTYGKDPNCLLNETNFQQKVKVMGKLFDAGVVSEKNLQEMSTGQMIGILGITIPEIGMILEFQQKVKSNHLYSYLAEGRKFIKQEKTEAEDQNHE